MLLSGMEIDKFIEKLASNSPTPGGGGASALAGAIGVALGNMVASLTVGKKKYAEVEAEILELSKKASVIQEKLLQAIDDDASHFEPLAKAYRLPANTAEEIAHKEKVMEVVLVDACQVPLTIMRLCCQAIELLEVFAEKGSVLAVSDAGVGATLCRSALEGASLNVFINTGSMKDREKALSIKNEANDMLEKYAVRADALFEKVKDRLDK